jgi:hypothetical protein
MIAESMDAIQIERDVARCTWHLMTGSQRSRRLQYKNKHRKKVASLLRKKQRRLGNFINLTLVQSYNEEDYSDNNDTERLLYYQGYHDVASIFLSALGGGTTIPELPSSSTPSSSSSSNNMLDLDQAAMSMGLDLPARVLCQVSRSHLRDSMRSSFLQLQNALKLALFPLLFKLDRQVHDHLHACDMEPYFCLSWVITWFSHDVRDTELVKRLFDAFLVSHPLLPVYMTLAMMLHPVNRSSILETECDFASLHQCLANLPRHSCRVGFKPRSDGQCGYMSDEEGCHERNEGDHYTALTDLETSMDASSMASSNEHFHTDDNEDDVDVDDDASVASSVLQQEHSVLSIGPIGFVPDNELVPFQDLIDTSLIYMRRFPPRCLIPMAKRYYRETIPPMLMDLESTVILNAPPRWSLAATAKADWVLKQRARAQVGLKATSRKDRKKNNIKTRSMSITMDKNKTMEMATTTTTTTTPLLVDENYIKKKIQTRAVIATGCGPSEEEERKRRKRRHAMMGVMVGLVALSAAVAATTLVMTTPSTTSTATSNQDQRVSNESSSVVKNDSTTTTTATLSLLHTSSSPGRQASTSTTTATEIPSTTSTTTTEIPSLSTTTTATTTTTTTKTEIPSLSGASVLASRPTFVSSRPTTTGSTSSSTRPSGMSMSGSHISIGTQETTPLLSPVLGMLWSDTIATAKPAPAPPIVVIECGLTSGIKDKRLPPTIPAAILSKWRDEPVFIEEVQPPPVLVLVRQKRQGIGKVLVRLVWKWMDQVRQALRLCVEEEFYGFM